MALVKALLFHQIECNNRIKFLIKDSEERQEINLRIFPMILL